MIWPLNDLVNSRLLKKEKNYRFIRNFVFLCVSLLCALTSLHSYFYALVVLVVFGLNVVFWGTKFQLVLAFSNNYFFWLLGLHLDCSEQCYLKPLTFARFARLLPVLAHTCQLLFGLIYGLTHTLIPVLSCYSFWLKYKFLSTKTSQFVQFNFWTK